MAFITLTGSLRDSQNNPIPLATVRFKATATSYDVLQSVTATVTTDTSGDYDFNLNHGRYEISIKTANSPSYYVLVQDIVINDEITENNLNDLIANFNQTDLLTPEVLITLRGLADSATTSTTEADQSATAAATSETNAANSAQAAKDSEQAAAASESNAQASETAAATSESIASTSAGDAANSASAAQASEQAAATSKDNAAQSAIAAEASETAAATSESNAATSESSSAASESAAALSAADSQSSADYANNKASDAAASASAASISESNAATSETNAADSAQAASDSASAAQSSETAAANSATVAAQARDAAQSAQSDAETSASNAATSEANAAQSAEDAAASVATSMRYMGAHDASIGAFPDTTNLTEGALYKISTTGDINGETYRNGDQIIYNGTDWDHVDNTESVTSVAGKVGDVAVSKSDVGLSNVRNVASYSQSESDTRLAEKLDRNANAVSASKLSSARTITLGGDLSGSTSFDGSSNVTITASVQDDGHNHIIGNIDGLQGALNGKQDVGAKAADSELLDGINSSQFVRNDLSSISINSPLATDNNINIGASSPYYLKFWETASYSMSFGYNGTGSGATTKIEILDSDGIAQIEFFADGAVSATSFTGDGSGLTGTASLRATGTTKDDVGLGNLPNATTASRTSTSTTALLQAKGMNDHITSDDHDSRYYTKSDTDAVAQQYAVPSGGIIMWSGSIANIPTGWALCDGSDGTPDLTSRFVLGAGGSYAVGDTGGSADAVPVSHTHTASTGSAGTHSHSGSTSSSGSHTHQASASSGNYVFASNGTRFFNGGETWSSAGETASPDYAIKAAGSHTHSFGTNSTGAHTHTVTVNSAGESGIGKNIPPYYALAYIMKT